MGFPIGLLAGATLTGGVLYLTVSTHLRTRAQQQQHLQSQVFMLHALVDRRDPYSMYHEPRRRVTDPYARGAGAEEEGDGQVLGARRLGLVGMCKARWNAEVEDAVRRVERWSWADVYERIVALQGGREV